MKKKITLLICLLCTLLIFSACSKESRGVPESVFLQEFGSLIESYTSYKITHDVDTAAHIDHMHLELIYEGPYGTRTVTSTYMYQYDRASDLWTFLDSESGTVTRVFNERAYINASPMTGTYEALRGEMDCSYSITFHEIDMEAMTATIYYEIFFNNFHLPYISNYETVAIQDNGDFYGHSFEIGYPGSPKIESGTLWFWLDINTGLNTTQFGFDPF